MFSVVFQLVVLVFVAARVSCTPVLFEMLNCAVLIQSVVVIVAFRFIVFDRFELFSGFTNVTAGRIAASSMVIVWYAPFCVEFRLNIVEFVV